MSDSKIYSVSELSKYAGVSVRTLHYYDEIDLLPPIRNPHNGYREYHYDHLVKLQQILIYRELGFSIDKIKKVLDADSFDLLAALQEQKHLLSDRNERTQQMIASIEVTMQNIQGKRNREILFDGFFPEEKVQEWNRRLGDEHTKTLEEQLAVFSADEASFIGEQSDAFHKDYARLIAKPVTDPQVQEMILTHYEYMNRFYYRIIDGFKGLSAEKYQWIAGMITRSGVSLEMHEHYAEGLAEHLSAAITVFVENTLKENEETLRLIGSQEHD